MRFVDLFAGLGGFHKALAELGHECVFASEINSELRDYYQRSFPGFQGPLVGDIREHKGGVPPHDILCAGFPCQPFSKSGRQEGFDDETRGTLFHAITEILQQHRPRYVILENVGNFERHDGGRTWRVVQQRLRALRYDVKGTEHIGSGGKGLISPHHLGFPHTRERFFIAARLGEAVGDPFPLRRNHPPTSLRSIVQHRHELSPQDLAETALTDRQVRCIDHWTALLAKVIGKARIPSFPIWGDELGARYPYKERTPHAASLAELMQSLGYDSGHPPVAKDRLFQQLPNYARDEVACFPNWKIGFIRQNREWFRHLREFLPEEWLSDWHRKIQEFPPSLRKLEWNCQGEYPGLWRCVLQFRPSGLRAKRYTASPSLVSMTETQIPILGPERRFITRVEGLLLQGFPPIHALPRKRADAFAALGNAVHVGVAKAVARRLLDSDAVVLQTVLPGIEASLALPSNESNDHLTADRVPASHHSGRCIARA